MSEHAWVTLSGDDTVHAKCCARCEAAWPTDALCTTDVSPLHPALVKMKQALADMQAALAELER